MKRHIYLAVGLLLPAFTARAQDAAMPEPTMAAEPTATMATGGVEILGAALGSGVENRAIVGEAATFDVASVPEVFCWTQIKADTTPTTVRHVYSVDGAPAADVPLSVNGSPWRTWSRKTVWPGAWKVEVQDEAGTVLKSLEFTVTKSMEMTPAVP